MIGPLTTALDGSTHVLVAIDKFNKWIEYTMIYDILHRFVFPNTIITDLGSNFHSHQFWDFYKCNSIEVKYVSVAHPQANGQVERANGLILDGLKKGLYNENNKKGSKRINEISLVIWGLRTQPSKATEQSPFFLVYGSEVILPVDVMWKSPRLKMYEEGKVDSARLLELDSTKEIRCNVLLQPGRYLQGIRCYHDRMTLF
jgi:hypothetical protein